MYSYGIKKAQNAKNEETDGEIPPYVLYKHTQINEENEDSCRFYRDTKKLFLNPFDVPKRDRQFQLRILAITASHMDTNDPTT